MTLEAENDPYDIDTCMAIAYGAAQQAAEIADPAYRTLFAELDGSLARVAHYATFVSTSITPSTERASLRRW